MKVRTKPGTQNRHLLDGVDYVVVGVNRWMGREPFVMLLDEDDLPFGVPVSDVITVDDRIPTSWTVAIEADGNLSFQPASWQHPAFWNAFWDEWHPRNGELPRDLRTVYDREVARILNEAG